MLTKVSGTYLPLLGKECASSQASQLNFTLPRYTQHQLYRLEYQNNCCQSKRETPAFNPNEMFLTSYYTTSHSRFDQRLGLLISFGGTKIKKYAEYGI
jgi:hypothetical protein